MANPVRRVLRSEPMPFPDYPANARSFVTLNSQLLPYWHMLFDVCPGLLRIDPPDGIDVFRSFMVWAYQRHPAQDWTFYLSVLHWLLQSSFHDRLRESDIEALLMASAARWVADDGSAANAILLTCRTHELVVFDCKTPTLVGHMQLDEGILPRTPWEFAWCPLERYDFRCFRRWLKVPGL